MSLYDKNSTFMPLLFSSRTFQVTRLAMTTSTCASSAKTQKENTQASSISQFQESSNHLKSSLEQSLSGLPSLPSALLWLITARRYLHSQGQHYEACRW